MSQRFPSSPIVNAFGVTNVVGSCPTAIRVTVLFVVGQWKRQVCARLHWPPSISRPQKFVCLPSLNKPVVVYANLTNKHTQTTENELTNNHSPIISASRAHFTNWSMNFGRLS
ncbi:hypothetical protein TcWFU_005863 [Taenia crassiceps]|uniref:Uncharacterized protein n=1 Tax=Taenia crassiceps TaxID=6207 RepID=A0ABR4QLC8_9CEST